jgi:hypothetical protein
MQLRDMLTKSFTESRGSLALAPPTEEKLVVRAIGGTRVVVPWSVLFEVSVKELWHVALQR